MENAVARDKMFSLWNGFHSGHRMKVLGAASRASASQCQRPPSQS